MTDTPASRNNLIKASVVLAVFSFAADVVALLRDRVLGGQFGASSTLDVYYSAFKVPDLIFNLLVLGALSSAFIPVFIEERRRDPAHAWQVASAFATRIFVTVLGAAVLIGIFARPLSFLIAPGFDLAQRAELIQLMRVMLLSPVLFSLSTILGAVLQSLERFWAYAIAPVLYNAGIIVGAVYLVPLLRAAGYPDVLGLGLGVVFGASLHLLVQAPAAWHAGFSFRPLFRFTDPALSKIARLMIPRTIGLGAYSIDAAVTNALASLLGAGSIAVFTFANNLQFVPIAVVGVSVATAVFPRMSFHAAGGEHGQLRQQVMQAIRNTCVVVIPVALIMLLLRRWIVTTLFGVGLFHTTSLAMTASVLGIFMFGVVAQSVIPIFARAFYALQDTRTPVAISILGIVINIGLGVFVTQVWHWDVRGLALAFVIAGNMQGIFLYLALRRRLAQDIA